MVGTWLGECCRQVEAEELSNSRNKIHQTTYQPLFPALYAYTRCIAIKLFRMPSPKLIRLKWRLLAVTNLKGGTDSLFFIYDDDHPGGAGRGPEDLAMLSLNRLEDRNH